MTLGGSPAPPLSDPRTGLAKGGLSAAARAAVHTEAERARARASRGDSHHLDTKGLAEPVQPVEPETIPPVSGPQRRNTQRWISSAPPQRTPTQPGLSAPPKPMTATERVLRAVGLGYRPVRAPR